MQWLIFHFFFQMSELPETIIVNKTPQNMSPEMASMLENFNRKNSLSPSTPTTPTSTLATNGLTTRQNLLNSSSNSTSSVSKSSQQVSEKKFLGLTMLRRWRHAHYDMVLLFACLVQLSVGKSFQMRFIYFFIRNYRLTRQERLLLITGFWRFFAAEEFR